MKLCISDPKTAKSYSVEVDEKTSLYFLGKKIKDEVDLSFISSGLKGVITGGSDKQGFPMLSSLDAFGSKKIFTTGGVGFKPTRKGERRKKRVCGKEINEVIQLVNVKLVFGDPAILEEKYKKVKVEGELEPTPAKGKKK